MHRSLALAALALALVSPAVRAQDTAALPQDTGSVSLIPEKVADFPGPMPTGVSVSHTGRIFVNFPRWGDRVPYTVAEVVNGKTRPFPDLAHNQLDRHDQFSHLVSVQSVVVDPKDRLWLLDTGSIQFGPTQFGGPKLVGIDLKTNAPFKVIYFPRRVVPSTSYLNDVRFDLRRGKAGIAYITDSGEHGPGGIIVADLATGRSWHKLEFEKTVNPVPHFVPIVENQPLMNRPRVGPPSPLKLKSDGIAISADGARIFYCPLASRELYSVSADVLADPKASDAKVNATIRDEGTKGASDGLESDASGHIYATDYENHQIKLRGKDGSFVPYVTSPHVYDWPDTMSVATNGYLYWTANQLQRMANYHRGSDLRVRPYSLYRVRAAGTPVLLK